MSPQHQFTASIANMKALIVLTLVALGSASDVYNKDYSYGTYSFHGKYPGKCGNDGLYFRDEKSFVFCSNGNSYVQPCAPGTRNSAYDKYNYGGKYNYRDFCDVNLVDQGYAVKNSAYGYNDRHDYGYNRDYNYGRDYAYGHRDYAYGRYGSDHGSFH